MEHIYRYGGLRRKKREFEKRYGKKKGDYVYGAVVEKVNEAYGFNHASRKVRNAYKRHLSRLHKLLR